MSEEKEGQIPKNAKISIETQKTIWQNVDLEITKNFQVTGTIDHDGTIKRVKISFILILNPKKIKFISKVKSANLIHNPLMDGISKITELFLNHNSDFCWNIFGVLEGTKQAPILISYYENLDLYFYTLELSDEEKKFLKIEINPN